MIEYLRKTADYNGNITVVPYGLGDTQGELRFSADIQSSASNRFDDQGDFIIKITTIDDFVEQNKIKKVDFIKADIEGFERKMLIGARNILRYHCPILAICTYHLPDDPQVLERLILEANPNYKIIHRRMRLFAYVQN